MDRNAQSRHHGVDATRSTSSTHVAPRFAEVLWVPPPGSPTSFPCVDCGLLTGNFCDGGPRLNYEDLCYACLWDPKAYPAESTQRTPLCSYCETLNKHCRFCRGEEGCTPPTRDQHWSGTSHGRAFDHDASMAATFAQWIDREAMRPLLDSTVDSKGAQTTSQADGRKDMNNPRSAQARRHGA